MWTPAAASVSKVFCGPVGSSPTGCSSSSTLTFTPRFAASSSACSTRVSVSRYISICTELAALAMAPVMGLAPSSGSTINWAAVSPVPIAQVAGAQVAADVARVVVAPSVAPADGAAAHPTNPASSGGSSSEHTCASSAWRPVRARRDARPAFKLCPPVDGACPASNRPLTIPPRRVRLQSRAASHASPGRPARAARHPPGRRSGSALD